jgi:hypothetical protein
MRECTSITSHKRGDDGIMTTSIAWMAYVRSMAFIGWRSQKKFGFMTPVLLDKSKSIGESNMTAIFWQIRLRAEPKVYVDAADFGFFPPPGIKRSRLQVQEQSPCPYIVFTLQLGATKGFHQMVPRLVLDLKDQALAAPKHSASPHTRPKGSKENKPLGGETTSFGDVLVEQSGSKEGQTMLIILCMRAIPSIQR